MREIGLNILFPLALLFLVCLYFRFSVFPKIKEEEIAEKERTNNLRKYVVILSSIVILILVTLYIFVPFGIPPVYWYLAIIFFFFLIFISKYFDIKANRIYSVRLAALLFPWVFFLIGIFILPFYDLVGIIFLVFGLLIEFLLLSKTLFLSIKMFKSTSKKARKKINGREKNPF